MKPEKLIPCPFCGEQPESRGSMDEVDGEVLYWIIQCGSFECSTGGNSVMKEEGSKEEAIKAWNTRYGKPIAVISGSYEIERTR